MLLQADWQESEWNRLAAATADVVLLVANANDKPQISVLETVGRSCCGLTLHPTLPPGRPVPDSAGLMALLWWLAVLQMLQDQLCNALKYLILLHVNPGPYYTPSGTRSWIEKRRGINQVGSTRPPGWWGGQPLSCCLLRV